MSSDAGDIARLLGPEFAHGLDRQTSLRQLRPWRDRLQVVLQFVPDAIAIFDFTGAVVYVNESLCRLLSIDEPSNVLGRDAAELYARYEVCTEDGAALEPSDLRNVLGGALHLCHRDTRQRVVMQLRMAPIWDEQRRVLATVAIFRDVTSERRHREQLEWLAAATVALSASHSVADAEAPLRDIARIVVPAIADACFVDLQTDGVLERAAAAGAQVAQTSAAKATLVLPLTAYGRELGQVTFLSMTKAFDESDTAVITGLVRTAAAAAESARLYRVEQTARRRIAALLDLTTELLRAGVVEEVAAVVARVGAQAAGAEAGGLWIAADDGSSWRLVGQWGASLESLAQERAAGAGADAEGPLDQAHRTRVSQWMESRSEHQPSYAVLPLVVNDVCLGVLAYAHASARKYGPEDRTFLEAIGQCAGQALDRARTERSAI